MLIPRYLIIISIMAIAVSILPMFILGEGSHIRIHDNLDSNIVMYKILIESGSLFSSNDALIPNIMNGLPRSIYHSELSIMILLFSAFGVFYGYVVNQLLIKIIAFAGMYLFLRHHVFNEKYEENSAIVILSSLCFSLIPFYPTGSGSVAGIPLILYAFSNILVTYRFKAVDLIIIILFPFYSSLILSGFFVVIAVTAAGVVIAIKQKRINYSLILSLIIISSAYLIREYRLVLYSLSHQFVTHRILFNPGELSGGTGLFDCAKKTFATLIDNYDPPRTYPIFHKYIIQASFLIALGISLFKKDKKTGSALLLLFMLIVVISILNGFYYYEPFSWMLKKIPLLNIISFWRFLVFLPFLWYVIYAISMGVFWNKLRWGRYIVPLLIVMQIIYLAYNSDEISERRIGDPSFKEFFSAELFDDIRRYIGKEQGSYRVGSIALHPGISAYNGFYTIDGYVVNYPLDYKKRFRDIIATELSKNNGIKNYFDNWGSRCYLFTAELPFAYWYIHMKQDLRINRLQLDSAVLKSMDCHYILSGVEIDNYRENNLELMREFEKGGSPYKIRLYRVL